jgi:antitoxin component of RelBE/YafQ-DinJ toxin-antitoxin module
MASTPLRALRIDDELWEAAQAKAEATETTVSGAVRELLTDWIESPIGEEAGGEDP